MEMTEINEETALAADIQAADIPAAEFGHSLLALIQTHERAELPPTTGVNDQPEQRHRSHTHSLRMAEMYIAIGQLLELLHERVAGDQSQQAPIQSSGSIEEIQQMIQTSEERHYSTIEATLKQWQSERRAQEADRILQMESLHVQSQIEVNRLLRVMWLGTGLAAAGAGLALFLMSN